MVVAMAALITSACGGQDSRVETFDATGGGDTGQADEWGPLAVVLPGDGIDEALISGLLVIGDECVILDERGD